MIVWLKHLYSKEEIKSISSVSKDNAVWKDIHNFVGVS